MKKVFIIFSIVIVAGIVWWFASPLFVSNTVDEDFPTLEELEEMSGEEKEAIAGAMMEHAATQPPTVVEEERPTAHEPIVVATGQFRGADSFHTGSGTATIYEVPNIVDGGTFLRFENFSVTNGPDLHVLLSAHPNPTNEQEVKESGYTDLGSLKGNKGDQNYPIPTFLPVDGIDISRVKSIVIYCKPFSVVFSTATLE